MRVNYKGMDADYNYRVAEIAFEEEKLNVMERIAFLMRIHSWNIDIVTDGYAMCEVNDIDEYKEFMKDWKACKKCILDCIKFGF